MTLAPGLRLGPYEITARLGAGGMGEVYRATDTKLKREVAIKVLPEEFTADKERLGRLEREAQLLAQLHHPNIASIFGLEESDGTRALVMELVEGPTLAERLEQGPFPFTESLSVSLQIAQALEEAHEKGIVHRDLKPQNIKASIEGKVKVLDFGLAKAMDPMGAASGSGSASQLAKSPTLTMGATQMGMILGTAAYMSPEQAKGMAVDKRSDIWAFGVVLYEMLVGGSLFSGDSVGDTLAAVIRAEIDLERLPAGTPPAIRRLLRRCLERNPKNRLHDIADARIVLEEILSGKSELADPPAIAPPIPARRSWKAVALPALVAGALLGVAATALWFARREAERPAPKSGTFEIRPPEKSGIVPGVALSPDGRQLTFVARDEEGEATLWVRPLDSLVARELPGTRGARYPFWAPDSRRIGFFSQRSLKWIDSRGGTPLDLAPTRSIQDARGAAWGAGDIVLYTPGFSGPILAVPARGGESAPATRLPDDASLGTMRFPSFLPDGRRFVFYASQGTGTEPGSIHLGRLGSLDTKLLGPATSTAVYAPPGYLVYCRGDSLVAQRFDDEKEELAGDPVPLGITMGGSISVSGHRSLAVSGDGTLIYRTDKRGVSEIVWANRKGELLESITGEVSSWFYAPRLSPDGRSMLVSQYESNGKLGQFWVHDLERRVANRLTFDEGDNYLGIWLPGGREVLYNCAPPGATTGICRVALDHPGDERLWLQGPNTTAPDAATRDGRRVVFEQADDRGRSTLWLRDLEGESAPVRLSPEGVAEFSADLSPDGEWLVYLSDAAGEFGVYLRRLDGRGGAIRISPGAGGQPLWRRDGRELYYVDPLGRLVAVPITPGDPPRPGAPTVLFDARLEDASDRQYDVAADGQRFLLNRRMNADDAPLVVVLDWKTLLDRKSE